MKYINDPVFVDLQPLEINPLMSKCEIRVFYVGENRNNTVINKETAFSMAKTLRGCPIVGWYDKDIQDFKDHGNELTIEDNELVFVSRTKPYGFVAPDAKVWFQEIEDSEGQIKEYMMTEGYLWTEQFPECQSIIDNGKAQSMELDEKTLKGTWTKSSDSTARFFIINDAIFSKLCVLGDDVEPCFEDAAIVAQEMQSFNYTLKNMALELRQVLLGGQQQMDKEKELEYACNPDKEKEKKHYVDSKKEKEEEKEKEKPEQKPEEKEEPTKDDKKKEDEDKKKYALLEEKISTLNSKIDELSSNYSLLENEVKDLREYKRVNENVKKDKMIEQFYMLSEDDKKDVIEHKEEYTLDEIESKLSVIAVRNKVDFNKKDSAEDAVSNTFSLNVNNSYEDVPEFIQAMRKNKQK